MGLRMGEGMLVGVKGPGVDERKGQDGDRNGDDLNRIRSPADAEAERKREHREISERISDNKNPI